MDYNKIIISLVIILVAFAVVGFVFLNQQNTVVNTVAVQNNTSSSINVEKINSEDVVNSNGGDLHQSSGSDSKYVSKEYAKEHQSEWQSGKGYYWVGDTQYDSATGKIIGGGSAEDQEALREVYGDRS